jgi:DeoR/GlpR family transcriptional regulator of sugar metabolism
MFDHKTDYIELPMDEIIEKYLEEQGIRELGKQYGVSHETIRKRLIEHGVPLRTRGKKLGAEYKKTPKKDLLSLYKRGFTIKELAKIYESSYTLIYVRLNKLGVELIDPRIIDLPNEELIELYNQGWSQSKLSKKFNVSPMTINRRLKQLKVEARYKNAGVKKNSK